MIYDRLLEEALNGNRELKENHHSRLLYGLHLQKDCLLLGMPPNHFVKAGFNSDCYCAFNIMTSTLVAPTKRNQENLIWIAAVSCVYFTLVCLLDLLFVSSDLKIIAPE